MRWTLCLIGIALGFVFIVARVEAQASTCPVVYLRLAAESEAHASAYSKERDLGMESAAYRAAQHWYDMAASGMLTCHNPALLRQYYSYVATSDRNAFEAAESRTDKGKKYLVYLSDLRKLASYGLPHTDIFSWGDFEFAARLYAKSLHVPYVSPTSSSYREGIAKIGVALAQPTASPKPPCTNATVPAVAIERVTPDMPQDARDAGASGTVRVKVTISDTGNILGARIDRSSNNASLDAAALEAARKSRYRAGSVNCKSVGGTYLYSVTFENAY